MPLSDCSVQKDALTWDSKTCHAVLAQKLLFSEPPYVNLENEADACENYIKMTVEEFGIV